MLRGYLHLAAALVAPLALVTLVLRAESPRGYVGAAIFGTGLILLFATSAAYHILPWLPRARAVVRRIDHSMIFVAVAALYTPFCLQALDDAWGIPMLVTIWSLAAAGIILKQVWFRAPGWLAVGTYVVIGWSALATTPKLVSALHAASVLTLLASGACFTIGAIVFASRRPNPLPRVFGYHEVFHTLVTAGAALVYVVVAADVVTR
ncbi:MAG: PAQR family membrane homeostasis protein TrhA [Hyphomicrobiales bacterium]